MCFMQMPSVKSRSYKGEARGLALRLAEGKSVKMVWAPPSPHFVYLGVPVPWSPPANPCPRGVCQGG